MEIGETLLSRTQVAESLKEIGVSEEATYSLLKCLDYHTVTAVTVYDGRTYWTVSHYTNNGPYRLEEEKY